MYVEYRDTEDHAKRMFKTLRLDGRMVFSVSPDLAVTSRPVRPYGLGETAVEPIVRGRLARADLDSKTA